MILDLREDPLYPKMQRVCYALIGNIPGTEMSLQLPNWRWDRYPDGVYCISIRNIEDLDSVLEDAKQIAGGEEVTLSAAVMEHMMGSI